jgi:PASTA domain
MRRSASAVLVAVVLAACTAEAAPRPDGGTDAERPAPATGMDGRPVAMIRNEPPPPAGWTSTGEAGPSGPPAAIVPDVRGMVFADAVRQLWRAGIDFDAVHARQSDGPQWSVLDQNPAPGSDTPDSAAVNLVLSMSRPTGTGVMVRCRPSRDHLADPYCLGKLLKY